MPFVSCLYGMRKRSRVKSNSNPPQTIVADSMGNRPNPEVNIAKKGEYINPYSGSFVSKMVCAVG